jgi:hypothetical protein
MSHISRIDRIVHDLYPPLEGGDLEERDVGVAHVVKGDAAVDPLSVVLREAGLDVGHDLGRDALAGGEVGALGGRLEIR